MPRLKATAARGKKKKKRGGGGVKQTRVQVTASDKQIIFLENESALQFLNLE